MQNFNFNYKIFLVGFIALPLVFLFVTSCFDITGVTQPASSSQYKFGRRNPPVRNDF